ncbi:DNA topoisomerase-1 [Oceanotoga teriensis]|jgi:DNA topoisomerase-1|uniref:DNA topoisomerase 1 n=1 Tax=Oceanotoga teriensis TaxID=515440 RepID=A0AA45HI41_9BACT|nr:type I DNA topoisomerase [Oceanotoga teriensis]PWJ88772.1 DNA topoisomerase-1 [Oceanotoga teriensis]
MSKNSKYIVIVESPAKAKTIERYLGKDFEVIASKGHIRDLPKKKFGVNIENNFEPEFETMSGKEKVIKEIKSKVKNKKILLASDMDREGEAIAWHLSQILGLDPKEKNRIIFTEITKNSINDSIKKPLQISLNKVDAQIARRILDRIVGYKVSPLVWKVFKNYKTSAGRVQSAALKLIVDKERKIFQFKSKKYFKIYLEKDNIKIPLVKENGKKIKNEKIDQEKKDLILDYLKDKDIKLFNKKTKDSLRKSPDPFITSTLQQSAVSILGWSSKKTMQIAQKLYEGIETNDGNLAFITYMRTDSKRVSDIAQNAAKKFIEENYGKEYTSKYKEKKSKNKTQDAHEAIRPTDINMTPEKAKKILSGDTIKLYKMIWERFMASQTSNAKYIETKYELSDQEKKYTFELISKEKIFEGFEVFWSHNNKEIIYKLKDDIVFKGKDVKNEEKETMPPPRYSEASIVKELESNGIGRPSTYSTIISTLITRKYINKIEKNILRPTVAGFIVTDFLENNFPDIINTNFTANMEEDLDKIEEGLNNSKIVLKTFYSSFENFLNDASEKIKNFELKLNYESDVKCEDCNENMKLQFGRYGMYLQCEKCEKTQKVPFYMYGITLKEKLYIKDYIEDISSENNEIGEKCPNCGSELVLKRGRFGEFIACSNYPECKYTKSVPARGKCPKCNSEVSKLKSKKGKLYFKCTNKDCGEMFWNEPSNYKDPETNQTLFYYYKNKEEKLYNPETKTFYDIEEIKKK